MTRMAPIACLAVLFAAAGFLSFTLQKEMFLAAPESRSGDPLTRIIGSAKEAVGDTLFVKADVYMHGGVEEDFHETQEDLQKEGLIPEEHAEPQGPQDWIQKINGQIQVHTHRHLKASKQKELLPFLAMATTLDPHNVEAILTAAYWLDQRFGQPDAALGLLLKGRRDNPDEWQFDYKLAESVFKRGRDFPQTQYYCLQALKKIGVRKVDPHALIDIYFYLGESYIHEGQRAEAIAAYERALGFFGPSPVSLKETIQTRIRELRRVRG